VTDHIEDWHIGQANEELYEKARQAMSALQILCPTFSRNTYLKLHETPSGLDNVGSTHPAEMYGTWMGKRIVLESGIAKCARADRCVARVIGFLRSNHPYPRLLTLANYSRDH